MADSAGLVQLHLSSFRNLRDQRLTFPPEGVAILGRNAQGKSNLLEAIYYLEIFRSSRGARDEQLVRFGEKWFRIEGTVGAPAGSDTDRDPAAGPMDRPGVRTVSAAYDAPTREKRVRIDGRPPQSIAAAIGTVGCVLFTPDDLRLVSDGPVVRRRFLDVLLSLNDPEYLGALQRFRHSLSQRNAALRGGQDAGSVAVWDRGVCSAGARVGAIRSGWIEEAGGSFERYYREVAGPEAAGGDLSACIRYESSIPGGAAPGELEALEAAYREALADTREQERRMRTTLVGPHRDEMRFFVGAPGELRDVREFGSGGQRRTVALALRLLEADTVRRRQGREPILLLDDVFGELDEDRSRRVLDLLDRMVPGQVILTAPKERDVRFRADTLPRWTIRGGEVTV